MSLDLVRFGCSVRLIVLSIFFRFGELRRSGDASAESFCSSACRSPYLLGDAPSGVSMQSSEDKRSQSNTVGLGTGRQPGAYQRLLFKVAPSMIPPHRVWGPAAYKVGHT